MYKKIIKDQKQNKITEATLTIAWSDVGTKEYKEASSGNLPTATNN
jgi:hypothetical protein